MSQFSEKELAIIDAPNFAQVATVMANGDPQVDTVWVGRQENSLLISTTRRTLKAKNIIRTNKAALVITQKDNPYEQLQIRGSLKEIIDDESMEICDRISEKYIGKPFPQRHHKERIVLVIDCDKVRYHKATL